MNKETIRIRITEPCLVAVPGQERQHAKIGEELDLPLDEAYSVVSSSRGVPLEALPQTLKTAQAPARR